MAAKKPIQKKQQRFHIALVSQMLQLATAGLGLAAALAWNDTIKTLIDEYIKPYVSRGSNLLSQIIYTIAVTALAVTITYQLTKLRQRLRGQR